MLYKNFSYNQRRSLLYRIDDRQSFVTYFLLKIVRYFYYYYIYIYIYTYIYIGLEQKFVAFLALKFLYFKNFYILLN